MTDFAKYIPDGYVDKRVAVEKLSRYADMLISENKVVNLTAITDYNAVWTKHILDSLLPIDLFPHSASVIDIGSGGGCPAIPLAIMREDLRITMLESVAKKCRFLDVCVKELKLNATVATARAEVYAKENAAVFDVVTARALAELSVLAEYASPLLKIGGRLICYKGQGVEAELERARTAISELGLRFCSLKQRLLPGEDIARYFVILEKISATPSKYPRREGMAAKRPIANL